MDKLDRLGWSNGFAFVAHETRIGVRVSEPDDALVLASIVQQLGWSPIQPESRDVDYLYSFKRGGVTGKGRKSYHLLYSSIQLVERCFETDAIEAKFREAVLDYVELIPDDRVVLIGKLRASGAKNYLYLSQDDDPARGKRLIVDTEGTFHNLDRGKLDGVVLWEGADIPLSSSTSVMILMAHCFGAYHRPQQSLTNLTTLVEKVPLLPLEKMR